MIRFAIWTAVSTETQAAADKVSLPEQESKCRAAARAKGWRETAGPFVVPGESRTRWINLRDAEAAIPPLHELLDAAQRREFDVVMLYAYDRLRELLDPVSRTLAAYGVQLYSISQPVEPMPPEQYDLYATDTSNAVQFVSSLTSRAEINALRRSWRIGVPRRVASKGLHPNGRAPYGYRKPPGRELDSQAALIPDPAAAAVVIQIKDLYLAGQSARQISTWLREQHVPAPQGGSWYEARVCYILHNPFYAGQVFHGRRRAHTDPRTGKMTLVRGDPDRMITADGKHEPLWDWATYEALQEEMKRRNKKHKGHRTQRLSQLLVCAIHQRPLYVTYTNNHRRDDRTRIWFCPDDHRHLRVHDSQALDQVAAKLTADLTRKQDAIAVPGASPSRSDLQTAALLDLLARKERLIDALEAGTLDARTYGARAQTLDERIAATRSELVREQQRATLRAQQAQALSAMAEALTASPRILHEAAPQLVNLQLRDLLEKILVSENCEYHLLYRQG